MEPRFFCAKTYSGISEVKDLFQGHLNSDRISVKKSRAGKKNRAGKKIWAGKKNRAEKKRSTVMKKGSIRFAPAGVFAR